MPGEDEQFRELLDRWEDLREQGQSPLVEELCRESPQLAQRLREWTRVLQTGDWLNRRADEVAEDTWGESAELTTEEIARHRHLGEYTLLEELGSGGMGRVFRARHKTLNRLVAVKLLPTALGASPEAVGRFQRELRALARLAHPNIVAARDAGLADGMHFYVMDLVDGQDLAQLVKEQGALPWEQAVECLLQTARGLEHAHAQGVIHRDVKPSNLILDQAGNVQILDLGIARLIAPVEPETALTQTGCVLGTVDYLAPEQALNTRLADHRADIYSLGCTLWYLLTAQPLFGGETVMERVVAHREHPVPSLRKVCPAVPPWLEAVFRNMVAKRPGDRYQSVSALVSDLERQTAPRRPWRRRGLLAAGLLLAVGVCVLTVVVLWRARHAPPDPPIKPTWRTFGDFPLVAGVWLEQGVKAPTRVTIRQWWNGVLYAEAAYEADGQPVSWQAEGRISQSGQLTLGLVFTHPHSSDQWPPQIRTAALNRNGTSLDGFAAYLKSGHKFSWELGETAEGVNNPRLRLTEEGKEPQAKSADASKPFRGLPLSEEVRKRFKAKRAEPPKPQ